MGYFDPIPDKKFVLDDILKWIIDVIAVMALALFFVIYMCDTAKMIGNSMSPKLNNGESVLINKLAYAISEPERYDVIVFKDDEGKLTIKRIIGLPGEEIKIEDSKIFIKNKDGETILEEKYCKDKFEAGYVTDYVKIPTGEYFVLGDSRNVSEDSRFLYVGNINEEAIIGKAWIIYAPFNRIGLIK